MNDLVIRMVYIVVLVIRSVLYNKGRMMIYLKQMMDEIYGNGLSKRTKQFKTTWQEKSMICIVIFIIWFAWGQFQI